MKRSKQAGMSKKAIVVLLVGLALASVHLAHAQEPAKISRIGYLAGTSAAGECLALRHFGKGCGHLAMSKGRTLPLSPDTRRASLISLPN